MRYELDLTGNKYLEMEYQFLATAAFQVPEVLGQELSLLVSGFLFHHPQNFPEFCAVLPNSLRDRLPVELYYPGWAKLIFKGVQGGEIVVNPYYPKFPPGDRIVMTAHDGAPMRLSRTWPLQGDSHGLEYVLECSLEQPFGAMRLTVKASGSVKLSMIPEEFMVAADAVGQTECVYNETRSCQLHTMETSR